MQGIVETVGWLAGQLLVGSAITMVCGVAVMALVLALRDPRDG